MANVTALNKLSGRIRESHSLLHVLIWWTETIHTHWFVIISWNIDLQQWRVNHQKLQTWSRLLNCIRCWGKLLVLGTFDDDDENLGFLLVVGYGPLTILNRFKTGLSFMIFLYFWTSFIITIKKCDWSTI